jgi:hypothetical protein
MNPEPEHKPATLESLLRLKRAETPSGEFWMQFERELRAKQLAAIVEKRPWWCAFPRLYVFVLRHNLQIGSLAAVSLAFLVSYHEFRPASPGLPRAAGSYAFSVSAPSVRVDSNATAAAAGHASLSDRASASESLTAALPTASGPKSRETAEMAPVNQPMPSERLIAANLAAARAASAMMDDGLSSLPAGFEVQVAPVGTQVQEPLAQMATPWEVRRSRLMAGPMPAMATGGVVPAHISERLASRLSDDRLYESMSRYGVDNGGVSIRF